MLSVRSFAFPIDAAQLKPPCVVALEAPGVAASIVAMVNISTKVIAQGSRYAGEVTNATADIKTLEAQVEGLKKRPYACPKDHRITTGELTTGSISRYDRLDG